MSTRDFNFVVGPESSTIPNASTPTNANDTISKGWVEEYGFTRGSIAGAVADTNALKAIDAAVRQDNQIILVDSKGALYRFDSSSTATDDGDAVIQPSSGSGRWLALTSAGGSGGGYVIANAIAGESFDVTNGARIGCLQQRKCLSITAANSWLDINEGSGAVSVQVIATNKVFQIYDLGIYAEAPSELDYDLCKLIENALNDSIALALTYTVSYSKSTRKITIAAGSNFSILWNTGTHNTTNLGNALGYVITSDDTSANSFAADNEISGTANTSYESKLFVYATDASYIEKSQNYHGVIGSAATKGNIVSISLYKEVSGATGLTAGSKYYTKGSAITIDATNNKINFKENLGAELTATLTSGTYYRGVSSDIGYRLLCADIKSAMDTAGGTYTVIFNKNTNKFTITPSSGTLKILWLTGTNTATSAHITLGWTVADTSDASSQTSNVMVEHAGSFVLASSAVANSVYIGKATTTTSIAFEQSYSENTYEPVMLSPSDWLTTPASKDYGIEHQFNDQHENALGQGVRIIIDTVAGNGVYRFQYKTGAGSNWLDSTTTIDAKIGGGATSGVLPEDYTGAWYKRSKCFVDENGKIVIVIIRYNGSNATLEPWAYYSNDGGANFTVCTGGQPLRNSGSGDFYVADLTIRQNKAVILTSYSASANNYIYISDNSGSGYTTFAETAVASNDLSYNTPSFVFIQYFSEQTGINKYRIVIVGYNATNARAQYFKGDGTGEAGLNIHTATTVPISASQDLAGLKNRIVVFSILNTSSTNLYQAESNEVYNSGTLTFNAHADQLLNSGGSVIDGYNGYSSAATANLIFNSTRRTVLYGDYCYAVIHTAANAGSKIATMLFWTKAITTGSWQAAVNIGGSQNNQFCNIVYLSALHALMIGYKYMPTATLANNLTNGQIYTKLLTLNGDGSYNTFTEYQIDGGKAEAAHAGYLILTSSVDCVNASWEQYVSTYDVLKSNKLV